MQIGSMLSSASLLWAAPITLSYAETTDLGPTESEAATEIYQLEKFVVFGEDYENYPLDKEFIGFRGDALLKDTAVTITVVDEALIDDLKIETIGELSQVAANVDVDNDRTTFNGSSSVRIRGLSVEEQLFDLFPRTLPISLNNTKCVDILSGSNSVLVGQSEAGGKINVNSRKAELNRDRVELGFSLGNFEKQALFSTNQSINDQLAVTVSGGLLEGTAEQELSIREQQGASIHLN